jgi:hypothetical protein
MDVARSDPAIEMWGNRTKIVAYFPLSEYFVQNQFDRDCWGGMKELGNTSEERLGHRRLFRDRRGRQFETRIRLSSLAGAPMIRYCDLILCPTIRFPVER